MITDLLKVNYIKDMESDDSDISDIWDCKESPLEYMIEPKGQLKIINKKDFDKTTVEELQNILPPSY